MGRSRSQRRSSRLFDSDDDTLSSSSTGGLSDLTIGQDGEDEQDKESLVLENYLEALFEKRGSTREDGLKGLINAFTSHVQHKFVEERNVTLLDRFVSSMKLSSTKRQSASEAALAAHALGLLAITAGSGDIACQIVKESIPHLFCASKLGYDTVNRILVIESIAIVTFVGGNDAETENSMDALWQLVQHEGNTHANQVLGSSIPQPAVRAAAISAWAFLLTTIPPQRIDSHYTKLSLPTLSSLLDKDDRAVRVAAGEAIALIFETSNWGKHDGDDCDCIDSDSFDKDNNRSVGKTVSVDVLQRRILERMKALSIEAGGKGSSKKELNSQRSSFQDFLASVKDGVRPEASVKLQHGDVLELSTWTRIIQINLLRRYLGGGFQKHMQENSLLHDVFEFTPRQEKQQVLSSKQKRLFMSSNSVISKARTQALNRQRRIAQAGNHGHYDIGLDEE